MHNARSPGRRQSRRSNNAAACAVTNEAMLSLPPLRPITHHSSRTGFVGGSRSATVRKKARSASDMDSANAPLSTVRQLSQLEPLNQLANNSFEFIAATMSSAGLDMRALITMSEPQPLASSDARARYSDNDGVTSRAWRFKPSRWK